ncbi:MAG: MMPL family transporter [Thermoanaerobaculia bacterium]|nr:MMPL family transporter [Thermoanaerobaculia bacterium]
MSRGPFLGRLFRFAERRPGWIFLGVALAVAASLGLAARLRFDGDMLALLPERDPVLVAYRETLELFGNVEYLPVAVRIPEGAPVDPYQGFAVAIADELAGSPLFSAVEARLGDPEELLRAFLPKALLYLGEEERRQVAERLGTEALANRAREIRRLLETPQSLGIKQLLALDPAGLTPVLVQHLGAGRGTQGIDWASGHYLSRDHRLLLVLAKPVRSPQDIAFDREVMAAVDAATARARAAWPEIAGEDSGPPPEVVVGGTYAIALADAELFRRDVVWNVVTSVAGVLLAFAFVPLACGLAVTFGFAKLSVGVLNSATAGVAALLVGLGIDYVIVLYNRYVEERQAGADLGAAFDRLAGAPARGVVGGAVTTAATFYAFLVTDFRGLFQMGLLVGTGILLCLVAVLLLAPAILAWNEAHHRKREREPVLRLHAFGAERIVSWAMASPRAVLTGAAVVTLVLGAFAFRLRFEDNVQALRPPGNPGVLATEEISRHFGSGFDYLMLRLEGRSAEEVLDLADRAARAAAPVVERGELGGFESPTFLVPPLGRQREALAWLAEERGNALAPARVRADLLASLAAEGLRSEPFGDGIELLAAALSATEPIRVEDYHATREGRALLERSLRRHGEEWRGLVKLYPPPNTPKRVVPPAAEALAAEVGEGAELTGLRVVSRDLRGRVHLDALYAALLGTLVVALFLWWDLRRLRLAVLALLPLLVGVVWMVGAMGALGVAMNFMNIFVTTMVIGIGVDYGLHVVHRWREDRTHGETVARSGVREMARAVVLAVATTVAGFGSLYVSSFPGLRSMGLVAVLGTVAAGAVAVTVLPAALALGAGERGGGPR